MFYRFSPSTSYPETLRPRGTSNWDRQPTWLDRINTGIGYALWLPVPLVGVGTRQISDQTTYSGIFRRDTAEGYGRIIWTNGDVYVEQVRDGWERGYGVKIFSDGRVLAGYHDHIYLALGASVSKTKDRIFVGTHDRGQLTGYGRQIGVRNGVDSFTSLWSDRGPSDPLVFPPDTYAKIAKNYEENPMLSAEAGKYAIMAQKGHTRRRDLDMSIVRQLSAYL